MTDVAAIDTSQVAAFSIYPRAEEGERIDFSRSDGVWQISMEGITAPANSQAVRSFLSEISGMETQQLVSRDPGKWEQYQVSDSLGTRVVIREGNRVKLDLVVGRFQYQAPSQSDYNMYGQNRVTGKTYIRLHGEKEVYSVDGFFAMSVNQTYDRWRDQTLSRVNKALLTRLSFDYPADSGFVARKSENRWLVAGLPADSASMEQYLNRMRNLTHAEFADGTTPTGPPDFQLTMEGDNMSPVVIRAFGQADSTYLLNSSLNQQSWFRTDPGRKFREIFPGSSTLLAEGK